MIKIALTGGIGTGKTFISKNFIKMGIPVFYADEEAKKCYQIPEIIDTLRTLFGKTIFTRNKLDFKKMAKVVFCNPKKRELVNQLIHPKVMESFDAWSEKQNSPSVMLEAAVIFENDLAKFFDMVIVVDAPEEVRFERIRKRNPSLTEAEIRARMAAQMPQEEKCRLADMVIYNG